MRFRSCWGLGRELMGGVRRYLRALAAFYVRLTFDPLNAYEVLEPLLDDYRKLRFKAMGAFSPFCLASELRADPAERQTARTRSPPSTNSPTNSSPKSASARSNSRVSPSAKSSRRPRGSWRVNPSSGKRWECSEGTTRTRMRSEGGSGTSLVALVRVGVRVQRWSSRGSRSIGPRGRRMRAKRGRRGRGARVLRARGGM